MRAMQHVQRRGRARALAAGLAVGLSVGLWASTGLAAERYGIGTAGAGGVFQIFGAAIAEVAQQAVPGLSMSVVATQGSAENAVRVGRGELHFALAGNDAAYNAFRGGPGFPRAVNELRVAMGGHKQYMHVLVSGRSSVRTWTDLVGKRVGLTSPTSPNYSTFMAVFQEYGMAPDKVNAQWVTSSAYADAIRNGTLEAASLQSGYPAPAVTELCASRVGVRLLSVPEQVAAAVQRKHPYYEPGVIPAGTYSCIPEAVPTIVSSTLLIVHKDVPEQTVYAIVKAIIESGRLAEVHQAGREWNLENAVTGLAGLPLHPGAERYFRERGVLR